MKIVMEDTFLKLIFTIFEKLHESHNDLSSLPERMKIQKEVKNL